MLPVVPLNRSESLKIIFMSMKFNYLTSNYACSIINLIDISGYTEKKIIMFDIHPIATLRSDKFRSWYAGLDWIEYFRIRVS
jgi:hypothetical protein